MAFVDNTTLISNCDDVTNWPAAPNAPALEDQLKVEGAYSLSFDTDIETNHILYTLPGGTEDYTGRTIYVWMLCLTGPFLDTSANGGLRIIAKDSSSNESYYYVGGKDSYGGGWKCFTASLNAVPQANNGTNAIPSAITDIGVGFKGLAKSKLAENCFWDYIRYGTSGSPVAIVSGGTSGTPLIWADALSGDASVTGGFVQPLGSSYLLNGPIQFGDSIAGNDTYFSDTGSTIFWEDATVNSDHYNFTICAISTNNTEFKLGSPVGGQGVGGNFITVNNKALKWDFFCNTDVDVLGLYGCTFNNGTIILPASAANKEILTTSFIDCYVISPSSIPMKFCNIVGSQNVSAGVTQLYTNHNLNNCNFINTLGALEFMESGNYVLSVMKFYNNTYDIWSDFTTTAQATSGSNPSTTGGTGSVDIQNTVSLEIFNVYTGVEPVNYVRCYIETLTGGPDPSGQVLLSDSASASDGGGRYKATAQYNYGGSAQPVIVRARYVGFIPYTTNANIDSNGLTIQAQWVEDPIANV